MVSLKAEAKEITATFQGNTFELDTSSDAWNYDGVLPGDSFTYEYTIRNATKDAVRVRLLEIRNEVSSELYEILQVSFNGGSIEDMNTIRSDWYVLKPGEESVQTLRVYFPDEALNEYQGKELHAKAVFQAETEGKFSTAVTGNTSTIKTGDGMRLRLYVSLAVGSVLCLFMILIHRWRGNGKRTEN